MNYQSVADSLDTFQVQLLELLHEPPDKYNPRDWQHLLKLAVEACRIYQPYRSNPLIQRQLVLDLLLCLRHLLVLPDLKGIAWKNCPGLHRLSGMQSLAGLTRQLEAAERQIYHARLPEIALGRDKLIALVESIHWLSEKISRESGYNLPPLFSLKSLLFRMVSYWYFDATGTPIDLPSLAELNESYSSGCCQLRLAFVKGEFDARIRFENSPADLRFRFHEFMLCIAPMSYRHGQAIWVAKADPSQGYWFQLSAVQENDLRKTLGISLKNRTIRYYLDHYSQYYGHY